ncbi:MAG: methionine--tRNA ligase [Spirochaetia bacterium]
MKKKRLVTSALPYVNNTPHLGNLVQILSADVYARYCRAAGYETFYACGTDEYGTASETRALKEGITARELCDRYFVLHRDIYAWFDVHFDHFGRTSEQMHTKIAQEIYHLLNENGLINEKESQQLFCQTCQRFLADRFVHGTCPHCAYNAARGDQCEKCGELLDPSDLKDPHCEVCACTPEPRTTNHLYLNLPKVQQQLEAWVNESSVQGRWAQNALSMTRSWIRDGLQERCITRDLQWGVPVPRAGFENKVFYVWFDAPIGYISITAEKVADWQKWWKNPHEVELVQFIGKDNIPFHTVMFPASLLGTGQKWTMLHQIASTEYLNYETGKFSKSRGVGIFGDDCQKLPIPADVWRFYLFYTRPERHDTQFVWKEFQDRVNSELIGNFSNFINRTLAFCSKFYAGNVPLVVSKDGPLWKQIAELESKVIAAFEACQLKEALNLILQLSDLGNKTFQANEPWRLRTEDPASAESLIGQLVHLAHDLGQLIAPFLPQTSKKILRFLHTEAGWENLGQVGHIKKVATPTILFEILENQLIQNLRTHFGGGERVNEESSSQKSQEAKDVAFHEVVDLRVAHIKEVVRHPDAEKLYILQLQIGDEERQIVSSIVPYYKEEELLGKNIIVVANLKKAKFRGTPSQGMLLAAGDGEKDECEVLFVDAPHGTRVLPQGSEDISLEKTISIDKFMKYPMLCQDGKLMHAGVALMAGTIPVLAHQYVNSPVH